MIEAPGILNWLLEGLNQYLRNGLPTSPNVREATEDYRRGSNPFGDWWAERVIEDPTVKILSSTLYADFNDFCERNQVESMTSTAFGRALGDRQVVKVGKGAGGKIVRRGAKLREQSDDDDVLGASSRNQDERPSYKPT